MIIAIIILILIDLLDGNLGHTMREREREKRRYEEKVSKKSDDLKLIKVLYYFFFYFMLWPVDIYFFLFLIFFLLILLGRKRKSTFLFCFLFSLFRHLTRFACKSQKIKKELTIKNLFNLKILFHFLLI